jgi:hypothetical protein
LLKVIAGIFVDGAVAKPVTVGVAQSVSAEKSAKDALAVLNQTHPDVPAYFKEPYKLACATGTTTSLCKTCCAQSSTLIDGSLDATLIKRARILPDPGISNMTLDARYCVELWIVASARTLVPSHAWILCVAEPEGV